MDAGHFWSFTKRRLAKFNGSKVNFELHLKECEWRWKKNELDLEKELWDILTQYLKHLSQIEIKS
jgi:transposase